jgi:hypothetical protein
MDGIVSWEGYSTWFSSWVNCLCASDIGESFYLASVDVSFRDKVIIFEDSYTNSVDEIVFLNSTTNVLSINVKGGQFGGLLEIEINDDGKLSYYDGDVLFGEYEIEAGENLTLLTYFTANKSSLAEDDINVKIRFIENMTGEVYEDSSKITAVRVRIAVQVEAPMNAMKDRHKVGVCERMGCKQYPSTPKLQWVPIGGGTISYETLLYDCIYQNPEYEVMRPLIVGIESLFYQFNILVVEPEKFIASNVVVKTYGVAENFAGGIGMSFDYYLMPSDVSFLGIYVQEMPSTNGVNSGYFSLPYFRNSWHHSRENGAGKWICVDANNQAGVDTAAWTNSIPKINNIGQYVYDPSGSWSEGSIEWKIPYAWHTNVINDYTEPYKVLEEETQQCFAITSNGTVSVQKLGNSVYRMTNDWQFINGVRIK